MSAAADPFQSASAALVIGLTRGDREIGAVGQFDPEWRLLGRRHIVGHASRLALPVRTIVADALAFGAHAVIVAHGHPSGDPQPSDIDIAYTKLLARTLAAIDVRLADHLIVGVGAVVSLRGLGLL